MDARIIGIDPGTLVAGYGIIECNMGRIQSVACGAWNLGKNASLPSRLSTLSQLFIEVVNKFKPTVLCIELPFVAFNIRSALVLGTARGVILQHAYDLKLDIFEISATSAKKSISGNGYASKEHVAKILSSILGIDLTKMPLDATDALSIAYAHAFQAKSSCNTNLEKYDNPTNGSYKKRDNAKLLQEWQDSVRKKRTGNNWPSL